MTGKRRLIYLAVIGVGVGALIVDRLLAGGRPASAAAAAPGAAQSAKPGTVTTPAKPIAATVGRLLVTVLPFPQPLQDTGATVSRDPFVMAPAVLDALAPTPAPVEAQVAPEQAELEAIESFVERHLLSGVMLLGYERVAVVDGMSVELGSQVDECTVSQIEARSVTFSCPGGPVQLRLQSPLPDPGSGGLP